MVALIGGGSCHVSCHAVSWAPVVESPCSYVKPRPLRRSQLISPFGVGAISDFRGDEALMCAGLDEWFARGDIDIPPHLRLEEARLQRRLGRSFFVRPPEHKGQDQKQRRIPFVRFPQWHWRRRTWPRPATAWPGSR